MVTGDVLSLRRDAHVVLEGQVTQAQSVMMGAIQNSMSSSQALSICELLNVLIASDELYCQALDGLMLVCRLCEMMQEGNIFDVAREREEIGRFGREYGGWVLMGGTR